MKASRGPGIVLLAIAVSGVQPALAECECPSDSVERAVLDADRVFHGQVVSARIVDDNGQAIEFVVEVSDAIRGDPANRYRLTTAMPDACGVAVRLGFRQVFVLGPGETTVSSCTGSGRAAHEKYPFLTTAIALVDLPISDARGAQRLVSAQFYSSYERSEVDEFFELVERIDPMGNTATGTEDRIEYRGIAVLFMDGKYAGVETL